MGKKVDIMMDDHKGKSGFDNREQEIIFSKSIKAGKRIYYIDVKRNKKDDLFVAITESKKVVTGFDENAQVSYEKHKIFLYKEDFDKFLGGLEEVIGFIKKENENPSDKKEDTLTKTDDNSFEFKIEEFEK